MKRIFILLPILIFTLVGWSQKPFKNKNIQSVPHDFPQSINVPATGVPIATQPLVGQSSIQSIPYLQKRTSLLPNGLTVKTSDAGLPTMIEGTLPTPQYPTLKTVEESAFQYLSAVSKVIQIQKPSDEFVIKSIETDERGQTHIRMQQVLSKIPVWGSEIIVHEKEGQITLFNGIYFPTPSVKKLEPSILNTQAETLVRADLEKKTGFKTLPDAAKEQIGGEQLRSELVIFHKNEQRGAERLTWHVVAYPNVLHRYEYFIDAENGAILDSYHSSCTISGHLSGIDETEKKNVAPKISENTEGANLDVSNRTVLDGAFTATALDLLNVSRTINTYQVGSKYYLLDASRSMYNPSSLMPNKPIGAIQTFDYNNSDDGPYSYITSTNNSWNNPKAVSSHYNAGTSFNYYRTTFNRNSLNAKGGTITSFINVTDGGQSMDNAYWNGEARQQF